MVAVLLPRVTPIQQGVVVNEGLMLRTLYSRVDVLVHACVEVCGACCEGR